MLRDSGSSAAARASRVAAAAGLPSRSSCAPRWNHSYTPPSGGLSGTAVPSPSRRPAHRCAAGPAHGPPTIDTVPESSSRSSVSVTGLDVRPFRALTYREQDPEHLARVSSPAYDLVTPAGRDRLAGAHPHNVVRLILPLVEPDRGGVADRVTRGRKSVV